MLFTRIQLDDFDDVFARFKEQINSSSVFTETDGRASPSRAGAGGLSQATWMMMATVNIASLLQYGADNALLAPPSPPAPSAGNNEHRSRRTDRVQAKAPTAIMLNQAASSSSPMPPQGENGGSGSDEHSDGNEADEGTATKSANSGSTAKEGVGIVSLSAPSALDEESMPEQLRYAIKLTFFLLEFVLPNPSSRSHFNDPRLLCPYLTMLLTFLSTILKEPSALRLLEKFLPWETLSALSSVSPKDVSLVLPPPAKINAEAPLPEDWGLRGMTWVGRRVYERGFWKPRSDTSPDLQFESEVDVLTREMDPDPMEDGEDETASDADARVKEVQHSKSPSLSRLRWKRTLFCISTMAAKHVPGLDLDPNTKTIVIVDPLKSKMQKWKIEEEQARMERRIERIKILDYDEEEMEKADDGSSESEEEEEVEDDDDDDDDEEVKELKVSSQAVKILVPVRLSSILTLRLSRCSSIGSTSIPSRSS